MQTPSPSRWPIGDTRSACPRRSPAAAERSELGDQAKDQLARLLDDLGVRRRPLAGANPHDARIATEPAELALGVLAGPARGARHRLLEIKGSGQVPHGLRVAVAG